MLIVMAFLTVLITVRIFAMLNNLMPIKMASGMYAIHHHLDVVDADSQRVSSLAHRGLKIAKLRETLK
jgi:hypothetical protein